MSTNHHKDFKKMFEVDFDIVGSSKNSDEEECSSLYELIKYIYHNTDDIDIKENIEWALKKCDEIKFLHDRNYSYYSRLYSNIIQRNAK
jgi:hypothetical protein